MVQKKLLEKIIAAQEGANTSPVFTLKIGLAVIAFGGLLYIANYLEWIDIDRLWFFPLLIGLIIIVIVYPVMLFVKSQSIPALKAMQQIIKSNPRDIAWAYKQNTYNRSSSTIVRSRIILASNSGQMAKLSCANEKEADTILMAMPAEINPAILIGYTKENKAKYFSRKKD